MGETRRLHGDSIKVFSEGVGMVLYRWSALRDAVENEWGGRESRRLADQIATDVLSWFTQIKEPLYIDDLELLLCEGMLSLNVVLEDDSDKEVAYELMSMHDECLGGNFRSIEILREASCNQAAHHRVVQVVNGDGNDDEEDDDMECGENEENVRRHDNSSYRNFDIPKSVSDVNSADIPTNGAPSSSNMNLDVPKFELDMNSKNMPVNVANGPPTDSVEADDGFVTVRSRKNKGRKNR